MNRVPILAVLLLAACGSPASRPAPASGRVVVLISIDGFPAYALDDPRLPVPTLRRLMQEGASARGMTIVNPTVTWPNHTTLATGVTPAKHGVLYNGLLIAEPGKLARVEQRPRADLLRAPTVYDLAHRSGLTTAQVDWVPPQTGGTITWCFNENPDPQGVVEKEMAAAGLISEADLADFKKGNPPWRDLMWTRAAAHILKTHQPNLLLFHLLNLDATHHRYGPKTPAAMTGISLADARVAEILVALEQAGLKEQATILVVSDHGFKGTKKSIRPNAALAKAGLIKIDGGKIVSAEVSVVPEGGTAMGYVRGTDAGPKALELLRALEGVETVWQPQDYAALGFPSPKDNPQMADFVLTAKPGYGFAGVVEGEPVVDVVEGMTIGLHGYRSDDPDMNAIFIAWGKGIKKGVRLETLRNVDVAPTVAALLGLRMEGVEGRIVSAALE